MVRKLLVLLTIICLALLVPAGNYASAQSSSTFFATTDIASTQTIITHSNGDLWPSCWAADDNLYAANGDGKGFDLSGSRADIVVNRISGPLDNLRGVALAKGDQVASIWGPDTQNFNRKPTGMLCVNSTLYLAVQNLNTGRDKVEKPFTDAPSASISKSTNYGVTWTWNTQTPMFSNHKFTTIFFLDFGKNNANAIDNYVYAYGLDYNWRRAFGTVPDPVDVYLARVTPDNVQNRAAWQFYAGMDSTGTPQWTPNIDADVAVLHDARHTPQGSTVISQGGVVYNKPLNRYLYTSWSGTSTFEFYEAPKPWGPWNLFLSKDFGFPITETSYGGYATTIPSKFISADGETMWVQSNICIPCGEHIGNYSFSLRKFVAVPNPTAIQPAATVDAGNLATGH